MNKPAITSYAEDLIKATMHPGVLIYNELRERLIAEYGLETYQEFQHKVWSDMLYDPLDNICIDPMGF